MGGSILAGIPVDELPFSRLDQMSLGEVFTPEALYRGDPATSPGLSDFR